MRRARPTVEYPPIAAPPPPLEEEDKEEQRGGEHAAEEQGQQQRPPQTVLLGRRRRRCTPRRRPPPPLLLPPPPLPGGVARRPLSVALPSASPVSVPAQQQHRRQQTTITPHTDTGQVIRVSARQRSALTRLRRLPKAALRQPQSSQSWHRPPPAALLLPIGQSPLGRLPACPNAAPPPPARTSVPALSPPRA